MRCLVTGASGLIGRHAVQPLVQAGAEVHAVARCLPEDSGTGITWHLGDLLEPGDAQRIVEAAGATHLLHLAWVTRHGTFWHAPENVLWRDASKQLIEAFHAHGGQRVVMAGTCAEYDWNALSDGVCHEETTPIHPHTPYGQAKAECHAWLQAFSGAHQLHYAWGRVFLLYGAGEDKNRLVPSVGRALAEGRSAACSSGTQVRDFMDARDVGRAFADIVCSGVDGEINVASGEAHSVAEVVGILGELSGRPDLVHLGALADRADDPPVLLADVTRLRRDVGFAPQVSLKAGLAEAYQTLKALT